MKTQIKVQDSYGIDFLIPINKLSEWHERWGATNLKPKWAQEIYKSSICSEQEFCACFCDYADL